MKLNASIILFQNLEGNNCLRTAIFSVMSLYGPVQGGYAKNLVMLDARVRKTDPSNSAGAKAFGNKDLTGLIRAVFEDQTIWTLASTVGEKPAQVLYNLGFAMIQGQARGGSDVGTSLDIIVASLEGLDERFVDTQIELLRSLVFALPRGKRTRAIMALVNLCSDKEVPCGNLKDVEEEMAGHAEFCIQYAQILENQEESSADVWLQRVVALNTEGAEQALLELLSGDSEIVTSGKDSVSQLVDLINSGKVSMVQVWLKEHSTLVTESGLDSSRVMERVRVVALQHMSRTGLVVSVDSLVSSLGCESALEAEETIIDAVTDDKILAKINQETGMVTFHSNGVRADDFTGTNAQKSWKNLSNELGRWKKSLEGVTNAC